MIIHAVCDLNDKKGSTIPAIKKYITNNFTATERRLQMISKLLKQSNEEGWLIQVSGHGASTDSHFKIPEEMKNKMKLMAKKSEASAKKEEKEKAKKEKEPTKRKVEKKPANKEAVPAKKKKNSEAPKKRAATTAPMKKKTA